MDFYIAPRIDTEFFGTKAIRGVGVGNVQGQVKFTKAIFRVDEILPFWHFVVTGMLFGADGYSTQRDSISFDNIVMAHQFHRVRRFFDQDSVHGI